MKKIYLILFFFVLVGSMSSQTACTGAPAANTAVISATQICQGSAVTLSLANAYSNTGINYQWVYSTTSNVGPWSLINGANGPTFTTNTLTLGGWYTCVILCANSLMTTTATAAPLVFGSTTLTTTIPYYEPFQVLANNMLPNCSWAATSLGSNCLTYSSIAMCGNNNGIAAFSYSNGATNAFYSNGIQLYAGIIYSVSLWARTNVINSNNWTNFSIAMGPNQSAVGTTTLITNNNVGSFINCTNLSTTFTVANNGIYYVGLYATGATGTTTAQYLYFDDLMITIPCTGAGAANSPTLTCSPANPTVCAGSQVTFTLSGADTYSPNFSNVFTFTPATTTMNTVTGTNTLTGCSSTLNILMTVLPMPNMFAIAMPPVVCSGKNATIITFGAPQQNSIVVSPTVSTVYTFTGGTAPCIATSTILLSVYPQPTITSVATFTDICIGDQVVITSSGASSYVYGNLGGGSTFSYAPTTNTFLLVSGIDGNGCVDTTGISFKVNACLGLREINQSNLHYYFYPNPSTGKVSVLSKGNAYTINVFDYMGKKVMEKSVTDMKAELDLTQAAKGLYYLRMESDGNTEHYQLLIQ